MRVHVERLLQQRRNLVVTSRVSAPELLGRGMRIAQLRDGRVQLFAVKHRQSREVAQLAKDAALVTLRVVADGARDSVEIPGLLRQRRAHEIRALVGGALEERSQRHQLLSRGLDVALALEPRFPQHLLRSRKIAEAEDPGERVVELRLFAVEGMLELVVREEWRIPSELLRPPEYIGCCGLAVDGQSRTVHSVPVLPDPSDLERLPTSVDGELRGDACMPVMQVLPPVAPHLDPLLPALVRPQQHHLERFGEGRFAGPVAPHDQRESGPRIDRQCRRRPDPAEPLNFDRGEEHRRLRGRCGDLRAGRRGGPGLPAQRRVNRAGTVEGCEDQIAGESVGGCDPMRSTTSPSSAVSGIGSRQ